MFYVNQESPKSATIFGTYVNGPVIITINCQSGHSFQYDAELVSRTQGATDISDPQRKLLG